MTAGLGGWAVWDGVMTPSLTPAVEPDRRNREDSPTRGVGARDPGDPTAEPDRGPEVPSETLLDLLGDEYTCELLRTLEGESLPARALIDRCDMSRPTVYRRLDRLAEAGLVESQPPVPGTHNRGREFTLVADRIGFRVGEDGVSSVLDLCPAED